MLWSAMNDYGCGAIPNKYIIEAMHLQLRVLLQFRPAPRKTIKIITYDVQTSQGVSTTPVLRVCTCHVIKKQLMPEIDQHV